MLFMGDDVAVVTNGLTYSNNYPTMECIETQVLVDGSQLVPDSFFNMELRSYSPKVNLLGKTTYNQELVNYGTEADVWEQDLFHPGPWYHKKDDALGVTADDCYQRIPDMYYDSTQDFYLEFKTTGLLNWSTSSRQFLISDYKSSVIEGIEIGAYYYGTRIIFRLKSRRNTYWSYEIKLSSADAESLEGREATFKFWKEDNRILCSVESDAFVDLPIYSYSDTRVLGEWYNSSSTRKYDGATFNGDPTPTDDGNESFGVWMNGGASGIRDYGFTESYTHDLIFKAKPSKFYKQFLNRVKETHVIPGSADLIASPVKSNVHVNLQDDWKITFTVTGTIDNLAEIVTTQDIDAGKMGTFRFYRSGDLFYYKLYDVNGTEVLGYYSYTTYPDEVINSSNTFEFELVKTGFVFFYILKIDGLIISKSSYYNDSLPTYVSETTLPLCFGITNDDKPSGFTTGASISDITVDILEPLWSPSGFATYMPHENQSDLLVDTSWDTSASDGTVFTERYTSDVPVIGGGQTNHITHYFNTAIYVDEKLSTDPIWEVVLGDSLGYPTAGATTTSDNGEECPMFTGLTNIDQFLFDPNTGYKSGYDIVTSGNALSSESEYTIDSGTAARIRVGNLNTTMDPDSWLGTDVFKVLVSDDGSSWTSLYESNNYLLQDTEHTMDTITRYLRLIVDGKEFSDDNVSRVIIDKSGSGISPFGKTVNKLDSVTPAVDESFITTDEAWNVTQGVFKSTSSSNFLRMNGANNFDITFVVRTNNDYSFNQILTNGDGTLQFIIGSDGSFSTENEFKFSPNVPTNSIPYVWGENQKLRLAYDGTILTAYHIDDLDVETEIGSLAIADTDFTWMLRESHLNERFTGMLAFLDVTVNGTSYGSGGVFTPEQNLGDDNTVISFTEEGDHYDLTRTNAEQFITQLSTSYGNSASLEVDFLMSTNDPSSSAAYVMTANEGHELLLDGIIRICNYEFMNNNYGSDEFTISVHSQGQWHNIFNNLTYNNSATWDFDYSAEIPNLVTAVKIETYGKNSPSINCSTLFVKKDGTYPWDLELIEATAENVNPIEKDTSKFTELIEVNVIDDYPDAVKDAKSGACTGAAIPDCDEYDETFTNELIELHPTIGETMTLYRIPYVTSGPYSTLEITRSQFLPIGMTIAEDKKSVSGRITFGQKRKITLQLSNGKIINLTVVPKWPWHKN